LVTMRVHRPVVHGLLSSRFPLCSCNPLSLFTCVLARDCTIALQCESRCVRGRHSNNVSRACAAGRAHAGGGQPGWLGRQPGRRVLCVGSGGLSRLCFFPGSRSARGMSCQSKTMFTRTHNGPSAHEFVAAGTCTCEHGFCSLNRVTPHHATFPLPPYLFCLIRCHAPRSVLSPRVQCGAASLRRELRFVPGKRAHRFHKRLRQARRRSRPG